MSHTVDTAQDHGTREISGFLLIAFSFTSAFWWLGLLAPCLLTINLVRAAWIAMAI
jgi:hypothetical protein